MVAANETILNRRPRGFASRRRLGALGAVQESVQSEKSRFPTSATRPPLSSAASVVQKSVNCVTPLCLDDRQPGFPLRSPPLPRGSSNVASSWLCGEKSVSGTQPLVDNLYQVPMAIGMDSVTGLYHERNRNYSPSLGSVSRQDPAGYINGANTYQFVESNPVGNVDPWGLSSQQSPLPLPGEGIQQLADDIESSLYAAGGGSLYGWTPGGAAEFAGIVPRYQNDLAWEEKEVGEAAFAAALKLATMNMSEGAGKLVEAVEKARDAWKRAHPLLAVPKMEQYRFLWQRKYSENW